MDAGTLRRVLLAIEEVHPGILSAVLQEQPAAAPVPALQAPKAAPLTPQALPAPKAAARRENLPSIPSPAPQASAVARAPLPDSPESPDASPARPPPVLDDDMEIDLHLRSPTPSAIFSSSSSSDECFITVQGGKRKKKTSSKKSTSAPPAKTIVPPAAIRPPRPDSPPPSAATTSARKEKPPPPLFLREKGKWDNVRALLEARKINFLSARPTKDAIKISVQTSADHRQLTSLLRKENIGYHTYALEEERLLRVVIRGLPAEHNTEGIKSDLLAQNFPVREVHRMYSGRTKKAYDLVLVILDLTPEGKAIFNLKTVNRLSGLKVEPPYRNGIPSQCHRCQLYGHSARNCTARPRCVKCLGDHGTADCARLPGTSEPPSCVLCGVEGHTANYRGCPKAPKVSKKVLQRASDRTPPAPQYTKAAPKLSMVPKEVSAPIASAWARPLAYTSRAHQAKAAPLRPKETAPALSSPPAPIRPTKMSQSDLAADVALITSFDLTRVRVLARQLREAKTPVERVLLLEANSDLIQALSQPL